ncbi:MAG TPA: formate dehydrogenase accessory sulfurtransferase FdhD [Candidatus Nanopelagicales bacterium]|jgi:FdhD protein
MGQEAQVGSAARVRVLRLGGAGAGERADAVVVEEPLQVHLGRAGTTWLLGSTMRTPGHDLELAAGLAVAEGVVTRLADVRAVRHCVGNAGMAMPNEVTVELADHVVVDPNRLGRVQTPSSACGLCGRDEIELLVSRLPTVHEDVRIDPDVLAGLPPRMRLRQSVFQRTGGLHAAALADTDGELLVVHEDVGRHNAVDKVVGQALLQDVRAQVLVVSGRAGFEIVQKAAMAGIAIVASVSAPTSLSVEAARAAGLTLAAFVREGRMTVYSGAQRLTDEPSGQEPSTSQHGNYGKSRAAAW